MMVVRTAILIVAQSATAVEGFTAPVVQRLRQSILGVSVLHQQTVASQRYWVEEVLRRWCDEEEVDLIFTIGGTFPAPGPGEAEIVPEATTAIVERLMPSLPELMRMRSMTFNASALLDRGVAGIRGRTLIVNLPGDPPLTALFVDAIADHIEAVLGYLHPVVTDAKTGLNTPNRSAHKLNETEFAEFLRKRGKR